MAISLINNLPALMTQRNITNNQTNLQKTLRRLSTGLRINSAADDASGLAISEKLRSQINTLAQGTLNAQDGTSILDVANGGMESSKQILQRLKVLAANAASSSKSDTDRDLLQLEANQLLEELDRIASTTKFGDTTLLNGTIHSAENSRATEIELKSNSYIGAIGASFVYNTSALSQFLSPTLNVSRFLNEVFHLKTSYNANATTDVAITGTLDRTLPVAAKFGDAGSSTTKAFTVTDKSGTSHNFSITYTKEKVVGGAGTQWVYQVSTTDSAINSIELKNATFTPDGDPGEPPATPAQPTLAEALGGTLTAGHTYEIQYLQENTNGYKSIATPASQITMTTGDQIDLALSPVAGAATHYLLVRDVTLGEKTYQQINVGNVAAYSITNHVAGAANNAILHGEVGFDTNCGDVIKGSSTGNGTPCMTVKYNDSISTVQDVELDMHNLWQPDGTENKQAFSGNLDASPPLGNYWGDPAATVTIPLNVTDCEGNVHPFQIELTRGSTMNNEWVYQITSSDTTVSDVWYTSLGQGVRDVTDGDDTFASSPTLPPAGVKQIIGEVDGGGGGSTIPGLGNVVNLTASFTNTHNVSFDLDLTALTSVAGPTTASATEAVGATPIPVAPNNVQIDSSVGANSFMVNTFASATILDTTPVATAILDLHCSATLVPYIIPSSAQGGATFVATLNFSGVTMIDIPSLIKGKDAFICTSAFQPASIEDKSQLIQVGAKAGEVLGVNALSVRTKDLFDNQNIDITTFLRAEGALCQVEHALDKVLRSEAKLGALQNRYGFLVNNNNIYSENLIASESRIRDVNMALETTNFAKQQILNQVGVSMLAQANLIPQSILQLLSK